MRLRNKILLGLGIGIFSFSLLMVILAVILVSTSQSTTSNLTPTNDVLTVTGPEFVAMADYIPTDLSWRDLARYTDQHAGKPVIVTGKTWYVSGDQIIIQTRSYYEDSLRILRAELPDGGSILDGDWVTVYGWIRGDIHNGDPVILAVFVHLGSKMSDADKEVFEGLRIPIPR